MSDLPEGYRSPDHAISALTETLSHIERLGIRLDAASRFRQYQVLLEKAARGEPLDPAARGQAHLEASQLAVIATALLDDPSATVIRKLRDMVRDPLLPGLKGSPGRDAGFELLLGALIKIGGLEVRFQEPDIIVKTGTYSIGIAAKRIKSMASLESRLREARRQLRRQGLEPPHAITHGLVALDVTYATNPHSTVPLRGLELPDPAAAALTASLVKPVEKAVQRWAKDGTDLRLVSSVLVYAASTEYDPSTGAITDGASIRNLILDSDSRRDLEIIGEAIRASFRPRTTG